MNEVALMNCETRSLTYFIALIILAHGTLISFIFCEWLIFGVENVNMGENNYEKKMAKEASVVRGIVGVEMSLVGCGWWRCYLWHAILQINIFKFYYCIRDNDQGGLVIASSLIENFCVS